MTTMERNRKETHLYRIHMMWLLKCAIKKERERNMTQEEVNLGFIGVNMIVEDTRVIIHSIFDQHFVNIYYVPGNL